MGIFIVSSLIAITTTNGGVEVGRGVGYIQEKHAILLEKIAALSLRQDKEKHSRDIARKAALRADLDKAKSSSTSAAFYLEGAIKRFK